jgi:hypothetical protein
LQDCLNRVIPGKNEPNRRNIERVSELRDEAVHLVFSEVPHDVLSLFQASVLNYHKRLREWFGLCLSDRIPVGMMSLVYDLSPEMTDQSHARLMKSFGKETADFISRYSANLRKDAELFNQSAEFSIGIEYKLVLTKSVDQADISLTVGLDAESLVGVVEVPKDSSKSHPYRFNDIYNKLRERFPDLAINHYDIHCINKVYNVKKRAEWFYQGKVKGSPAQYSPAFLEWVIRQQNKDHQFFLKTRKKAKSLK